MGSTLLIDTVTNDLVLDAAGNIAVANEPYALAQDASCSISLFQGELYYDTTQGIPYWTQVLGQLPSISLVKEYMQQAALSVPGVVSATAYLSGFDGRHLTGQIQITDASGNTVTTGF